MKSSRIIHTVSVHTGGEVGDVIIRGVAPPPGDTLWDQRRWVAEDGTLRAFMLNEPRGGVFRHVNLLVPPKSAQADAAFIIMEPEDTPPMSGSNTMCVATVLLETGIVPMVEPVTDLVLEAPGGLVKVRTECRDGRVTRVTIHNLPSFANQRSVPLEVEGFGMLTVDTAFGGDSFVIVPAETLGFSLTPDEARDLAVTGARITDAANAQIGFSHPDHPDWDHISFCQIAGPIDRTGPVPVACNAVAIKPGKIDRSPTGTGVSARMALLHAEGKMRVNDRFAATSVIGSRFDGQIVGNAKVGSKPAILPAVSGRAWITGTHQHMLDPEDPWPSGYRLSDTWPMRDGG